MIFFLSPRVDWILKQKNPVFFAQKNARRIFLGMDVVQYAFYSLKTSNSCSASTHRPHACRYVTKKPCFRRFKIVKRREHKMFHFLMNLYTKRTTDFFRNGRRWICILLSGNEQFLFGIYTSPTCMSLRYEKNMLPLVQNTEATRT